MSIERELMTLKGKIDKLTSERDRVRWEYERLLKELVDVYGLGSIEEAEAEVRKLEMDSNALEAEMQEILDKAAEDFRELLGMA